MSDIIMFPAQRDLYNSVGEVFDILSTELTVNALISVLPCCKIFFASFCRLECLDQGSSN